MTFLRTICLAALLAVGSGAAAHAQAPPAVAPPAIAAAADLKFALDAIARKFKADTGRDVTLVYGSSGNLTQQLLQDAPFEIFLSADEAYVFQLADAGKARDRGTLYAEGRLAFFAAKGSPVKADAGLADLRAALADGRLKKFAIANPEHAPYGRAAEQALRAQGLWDGVQPKLVLGENVAQAAQFATSGSAEAGIFAYSLALSPEIGKLGASVLLPAEWHKPLLQRAVLMKNAGETAQSFHAYLQSPPARAIFRKYGFVLPGESS